MGGEGAQEGLSGSRSIGRLAGGRELCSLVSRRPGSGTFRENRLISPWSIVDVTYAYIGTGTTHIPHA